LAEHGGSFRNITKGRLLNRTFTALQVAQMLTSAWVSYVDMKRSGVEAGNPLWDPGLHTIVDPVKAANTLNGTTIWLGNGTQSTDGVDVEDGQYYKHGCDKDCAIDPNQMKNKKFTLEYRGSS